MADDDILEEELNLENVIDEKTYKKAMDIIEGTKTATKALKKATKEAKEVDRKLYGGTAPTETQDTADNGTALPKGTDEKIMADSGLVKGLPAYGRGNTFKQLVERVDQLMEDSQEASKERGANETRTLENETQLEILGAQVQTLKVQSKVAMGVASRGVGAIKNPLPFLQGQMMGVLNKVFPVAMAITLATTIFEMVKGMFSDGGLFDVRKLVQDEVHEYFDIEWSNKINRGEIFLGISGDLRGQGITISGSNTRDKSYGHLTDRLYYAGL